jgi:hypothetical protein
VAAPACLLLGLLLGVCACWSGGAAGVRVGVVGQRVRVLAWAMWVRDGVHCVRVMVRLKLELGNGPRTAPSVLCEIHVH